MAKQLPALSRILRATALALLLAWTRPGMAQQELPTTRILFLVDRNNLGKQTLNEFQQFVSPLNSYKFTEEFNVQHLHAHEVAFEDRF